MIPSKDQVISLLQQVKGTVDYKTEKHLLSEGIFDSIDMVETIGLLEESFGIDLPAEEIITDNFDSAEQICAMLERIMK